MQSTIAALLMAFVYASLVGAQDPKFEFTVSGALTGKLEPDTRVLIWSPAIETKPKWAWLSVKDMPVRKLG